MAGRVDTALTVIIWTLRGLLCCSIIGLLLAVAEVSP